MVMVITIQSQVLRRKIVSQIRPKFYKKKKTAMNELNITVYLVLRRLWTTYNLERILSAKLTGFTEQ